MLAYFWVMSYVLPPNLLGFIFDELSPEHSDRVVRHVRGAMERIAAQNKCTLHEVRTDAMHTTYDIWRLHAGQKPTTCLLVHRFVPYWTVTEEPPEGLLYDDAEIVDEPLVGEEAFELLGWQRLTTQLAAHPLDETALSHMREAELYQINSWKAKNVGQVLFNDWD